ncbi:MAG: histidinol phosphatase [Isosphaeraceae bacterium]
MIRMMPLEHPRNKPGRPGAAFALAAILTAGPIVGAHAAAPPPVRRTPLERLALPRLEATHRDALGIRESRRALSTPPGQNDYRAIFHAHAEDSAHTGGTRREMLADAHRAGVSAIFLSDHHRPPRDFINDSWRGIHEDVLFVPGSEARGFLLHPAHSIMDRMNDPDPQLIEAARAEGGLVFLSHIESRPEAPTDSLDGLEIYNRHADAIKDKAGVLGLLLRLTDPAAATELRECVDRFPDEVLAFQVSRLDDYLAKWDRGTRTRRLTGVAANDCHHNSIFLVRMVDAETVLVGTNVDRDDQMQTVKARLRPGIRTMTRGHKPGDILVRLDLDPYYRSFRNASTHLIAPELTEPALRAALRAGHAYVSHDWICDPTGFQFAIEGPGDPGTSNERRAIMGDEVAHRPGSRFVARFTAPCRLRLIRGGEVVAEGAGDRWEYPVPGPGVYRLEATQRLDGEDRPWIYSNPIYVRENSRP